LLLFGNRSIKYSPFIPFPGFVITGAAKLPFRKFFYILCSLSLPKAIFFTLVGYWFGQAYDRLARYFDYGEYLLVLVIVIFIAINYLFVRFLKKISGEKI